MANHSVTKPALPEPLSFVEINRLRLLSRVCAVGLSSVFLMLFMLLPALDFFSELSKSTLFLGAAFMVFVFMLTLPFFIFTVDYLWNKYADLPEDQCMAAYHLFGKRPELIAFRNAVLRMARPFVVQDYLTAQQYDSHMGYWERAEPQRTYCRKLYDIPQGKM